MKQLFCVALLMISARLSSQTLSIPSKPSPPAIDGMMSSGEWTGAVTIAIAVNATDSVKVQCLHDGNALYFAFTGRLESANMLFPEVLIDAKAKRGSSWTTEQWWFHVSATDCEHEGAYGVYNNCSAVQPGWQGAPNFSTGQPLTDTVEVKLPLSKLGLTALPDSMGIALLVTNTASIWKLWPATADRNIPLTWALARFTGTASVGAEGKLHGGVRLYPSPVRDKMHVEGCAGGALKLMDLSGRVLLEKKLGKEKDEVFIAQLPPGTYVVEVRSSSAHASYRQVIVK